MMNSRESIMAALAARLASAQFSTPINGCDSWALLSRRLKLWSDVASADQPALFIRDEVVNLRRALAEAHYPNGFGA